MADRYLYFILPGLIGAALVAGGELAPRLPIPARAAAALALLACAALGLRAHERARIWRSAALLEADAAAHYPDGIVANVLGAKRAAYAGDVEAALAALERAVARGYNRFDQLEADAAWGAIREEPRFRALVSDLASRWVARVSRKPSKTQTELRGLAHAHVALADLDRALAAYEAAVEAGGPDTDAIRAEIAAVRRVLSSGDPSLRIRLGVSAPD